MRVNILRALIFAQLIVILILVILVYYKKNQVLGANVSVIPINKKDLIFSSDQELKYFYEPAPNSIHIDTKPWYAYTFKHYINSDSILSDIDFPTEKQANTYRIITLGDSFTYGALVETKNNYPNRLEELLNEKLNCKEGRKFEIINLGFGGYDIQYSVKKFELRGQKYNPDLVLWFLKSDDFYEITDYMKELADFFQNQVIESGEIQDYYKKGIFYPGNATATIELERKFGEERILKYQKKALESMSQYYKGKLLVFTFPFTEDKYKSIMRDFVKNRKDSYFYDSLINIYEKGEALPDKHPNTKGYSSIALDLLTYIQRNRLITCN